jgi:PAS domain S-box-containing protein
LDAIQTSKRTNTALPTSKATVPLLAAGFLVLIGFAASWRQGDDAIKTALQLANNRAKLEAFSEIETEIRESESNARGYVITGNPYFDSQHKQTNAQLKAAFQKVFQLLQDSPSHAANLKSLNDAIIRKQALIQSSIELRKKGNISAALQVVNRPSIEAMRRLSAILEQLKEQSNQQLAIDKLKLDQATHWVRSFELVAGTGLLGLLISSGLLYRRQSKTIKTTTRQIAESESLFRSLFEQASMGRAIRTMQGECQVNQAYITMLGYSEAELTSMAASALIVPEDRDQWQWAQADLLSGKSKSSRLTLRYKHKYGSHLWIDESLQLRRNGDGEPIQWISTILDISKQKRLEAERRQLALYTRSLIEANPDTMINIKQDGSIQDVNEAMVIATGKDRKQLIGQDFSSYFSDPEKARIGYQKVFADGSVKDYEL